MKPKTKSKTKLIIQPSKFEYKIYFAAIFSLGLIVGPIQYPYPWLRLIALIIPSTLSTSALIIALRHRQKNLDSIFMITFFSCVIISLITSHQSVLNWLKTGNF